MQIKSTIYYYSFFLLNSIHVEGIKVSLECEEYYIVVDIKPFNDSLNVKIGETREGNESTGESSEANIRLCPIILCNIIIC